MEAILYVRTSTDDQRNGADAQRRRLIEHARDRGWEYAVEQEHASGKTLARRPKLSAALDRLDRLSGEGALVVTNITRLARSTRDFATILERAERSGWRLVVTDMGGEQLDTSTAMGRAMANMAMVMAELERELIAERTRDGLAEVRARGKQLGRPSTVSEQTRQRIAELSDEGLGLRGIAARLDAEGVPPPSGKRSGRWYPASVARQLGRT